jgi:hypothetical protein
MEAEEYYNKIRIQLGTQALLSYQIDGCRLYGKDAICKMLEDYHQAKLNLLTIPVVVSTSFCDTVECSNCGLERDFDGCIVCGES